VDPYFDMMGGLVSSCCKLQILSSDFVPAWVEIAISNPANIWKVSFLLSEVCRSNGSWVPGLFGSTHLEKVHRSPCLK